MVYYNNFNYKLLNNVKTIKRKGKGDNTEFNDLIITADTETSKKENSKHNHICAFSICIKTDTFTEVLYGRKPSEFIDCLDMILYNLPGKETIIYFYNLIYDWTFLRKFLINSYGEPDNQLNIKPKYPINLSFSNGLILKDALVISQRSLEKWAEDLDVEHKKAAGKWNYNKIRNQDAIFSKDELLYIQNDVLALAECLEITKKKLNKDIYAIPNTMTSIVREELLKKSKENNGKKWFNKLLPSYEVYNQLVDCYHGGYTHSNRYYKNEVVNNVKCYDFKSSYPYVLLSEKFPAEKFTKIENKSIEYIINNSDNYAFLFDLILINPDLKYEWDERPVLQMTKCKSIINGVYDEGRVISADYIEITVNEIDALLIYSQYNYSKAACVNVSVAKKEYLPRWLTDYIFDLFIEKTKLENGNVIDYKIAKNRLNSVYGLFVQRQIRYTIIENFNSNEYEKILENEIELYDKYTKKQNVFLPYQIGVWVSAYAQYNLFKFSKCCEEWLYSDTDSVFGISFDEEAVKAYNDEVKYKLHLNNYEYEIMPGTAELDKEYTEFVTVGAKRYCGRKNGELEITTSGVPKRGVKCLKNNINNYKTGFVFDGEITKKLLHNYFYVDSIYIDENGNETGDSINLEYTNYVLDNENLEEVEVGVTYYE